MKRLAVVVALAFYWLEHLVNLKDLQKNKKCVSRQVWERCGFTTQWIGDERTRRWWQMSWMLLWRFECHRTRIWRWLVNWQYITCWWRLMYSISIDDWWWYLWWVQYWWRCWGCIVLFDKHHAKGHFQLKMLFGFNTQRRFYQMVNVVESILPMLDTMAQPMWYLSLSELAEQLPFVRLAFALALTSLIALLLVNGFSFATNQ